jgi:hypothetical protein
MPRQPDLSRRAFHVIYLRTAYQLPALKGSCHGSQVHFIGVLYLIATDDQDIWNFAIKGAKHQHMLCAADAYPLGGYEVAITPFAPEAANVVIEGSLALLNRLAAARD